MRSTRHVHFLAALSATGLIALPHVSAALPPAKAPDHTAVYRQTTQVMRDGKPETRIETIRITVAGVKSRWLRERDGQTTIFDRDRQMMITWGGEIEDKMAVQRTLERPRSDWEFGYDMLATDGSPKQGASATIAGQTCTILQFETKRFGSPELCVTEDGVVSRLILDDKEAGTHITFEAVKISRGPTAPDTFSLPADFQLYE
jgi:hypothetical protein